MQYTIHSFDQNSAEKKSILHDLLSNLQCSTFKKKEDQFGVKFVCSTNNYLLRNAIFICLFA